MRQQHSVKKMFTACFIFLLVLSIVLIILYGIHSIRSYESKSRETTNIYLTEYAGKFYEQLSSPSEFYRNLVTNDADCELLSLTNCTESQKILSTFNLRRIIQSKTPDSGLTVLYNPSLSWLYYCYGSSLDGIYHSPAKGNFVRNNLDALVQQGRANSGQWSLFQSESGEIFLCTVHRNKDLYLAYMVGINNYVRNHVPPTFTDASFPLIFQGDSVLINAGMPEMPEAGFLREISSGSGYRARYHYQSVIIPDLDLVISILTPASAWFQQILEPIVFLTVIVLLLVLALFAAFRILLRLLVLPLEEVAAVSHMIASSDQSYDPAAAVSRYKEFNDIHQSILNLVEQKGDLEEAKRKQAFVNERTAFQYYQLQTRSHFFLNCLKSLYNLAESGNREKMQLMIEAFSNHLRYVFHDNMEEVTLKAELQEVADYHRIITLDFIRPFILSTDVPPQLMNCLIPPLTIQTFLENTYKYNGRSDGILIFGIDISEAKIDDESFLRIKLYDNGTGYSSQVLEQLNSGLTDVFDSSHIGINNLRRRMDILYMDKCQTAFMNTPEGGACSILYLPLRPSPRQA